MTTKTRMLTALASVASLIVCGAGSALAATPAPDFAIRSETLPTYLSPSEGGELVVLVTNDGGSPTSGPVTIHDVLPEGLTITTNAKGVSVSVVQSPEPPEPVGCTHTLVSVTCTSTAALPGDSTAGVTVKINVAVEPEHLGVLPSTNMVTVSGGNARTVSTQSSVMVASQEPAVGFLAPIEASPLDASGALDAQAGDHPNSYTTTFGLATTVRAKIQAPGVGAPLVQPVQKVKDVTDLLPTGLIGDPQAASTCPQALIAPPNNGKACPPASVVGLVAFELAGGRWNFSYPARSNEETKPVFNVPPEHGHPAQFAFIVANQEITLYVNLVHTAGGYAVEVVSPSIIRFLNVSGVKVTLFGNPAVADGTGNPSTTFFTDPVDCAGGPLKTVLHMDTWENPGRLLANGSPDLSDPAWHAAESVTPAPTGCQNLTFNPEFAAQPTTQHASSPSGLNVNLEIPQNTDPAGLATPDLKNVTVTLPEGLTISPSSANGLQACSDAQFAAESTEPATCPEASQVGTVKVHTPILANPVEGQVFVGAPECGVGGICTDADAQDGRMVRLFIQAHSDQYGVTVKAPGTVSLNAATGQLTATFKNLIEQPYDDLEFKFKDGEDAPLSTPTACGSYTGSVDLTPWSTPYTKDAVLNPGFEIKEGCGAHGFAPAFTAGTTNNQAGTYSPLALSFSRSDSQQDFDALEATLPPGLLAKLAGVPRCGEAEANAGTCPESTRIGTVTVGAGPGTDPYYVTGQVYLTGPYNGGPFGEVVEVPAVAGPFNLGVVAVRGSIRVNPSTVQATVVSNPFPSILDGIPLQVKTVNVSLDRPGFTFNPTNCGQMAVTGKLVSTQNASAGVSSPYQAANCASLAFAPKLTASVSGRASKADGAGLDVKVAYPAGPAGTYANTKSVKVDLPKQLPSRLTTLQKACLAATFEANPANCPAASDVGTATAVTPLLGVPVNGPAYLVSHGGEAFPDLETVLQGEGVTAIVDFNTDIKKGITSSTLKAAPDVPLSSFELKLPTGKYSILGANVPASARYSLCGQSLTMPTAFTGQNGTPFKQTTKIGITGCPKTKKAGKKKPSKASKSTRRGK